MDYSFGEIAQIPLAAVDAARQRVDAASITITVMLPDQSTAPITDVTDDDVDRGWYGYISDQSGLHRYRVVEATSETLVAEGEFYVRAEWSDPTTGWAPALTDIASLVPTRLFDSNGVQQSTFTNNTTPTAGQVAGFIRRIDAEIAGVAGDIPSRLFPQATHVAALGVAWLIERTYPATNAVVNLGNDFVNDYRNSLSELAETARGGDESGARAASTTLGSFTL